MVVQLWSEIASSSLEELSIGKLTKEMVPFVEFNWLRGGTNSILKDTDNITAYPLIKWFNGKGKDDVLKDNRKAFVKWISQRGPEFFGNEDPERCEWWAFMMHSDPDTHPEQTSHPNFLEDIIQAAQSVHAEIQNKSSGLDMPVIKRLECFMWSLLRFKGDGDDDEKNAKRVRPAVLGKWGDIYGTSYTAHQFSQERDDELDLHRARYLQNLQH
jgi:hypothetical protein